MVVLAGEVEHLLYLIAHRGWMGQFPTSFSDQRVAQLVLVTIPAPLQMEAMEAMACHR